MIHTNKCDDGVEIVLTTDDQNDGVFTWTAGRGYLIATVTLATDENATKRFTILCVQHHDELLKLERALWNTPRGKARMKPSNALERFKNRLLAEAGIKDS